LEKSQTQAQQKLTQLGAQEFACEADALNAARALSDTLPWHQLTELTAQPQSRYARRGKPTNSPNTAMGLSVFFGGASRLDCGH
jgi:hypothetical protein